MDSGDSLGSFTNSQIAVLQQQIRQYKALGKLFGESNIARALLGGDVFNAETIEGSHSNAATTTIVPRADISGTSYFQSNNELFQAKQTYLEGTPAEGLYAVQAEQQLQRVASGLSSSRPTGRGGGRGGGRQSFGGRGNSMVSASIERMTTSTAMSWQVFNTLLFCGPARNTNDGMIALNSSDIGCFAKSNTVPLVLTAPYASSLREKVFKRFLTGVTPDESGNNVKLDSSYPKPSMHDLQKLWLLQRQERSALIRSGLDDFNSNIDSSTNSLQNSIHPPSSFGPDSYLADLLNRSTYYKTKRQAKKDIRFIEREEKRKRQEMEDKKKKKNAEFSRALLTHRDDFLKFHKSKRLECGKTARLIKQHVEMLDAKKEKDEARAESKRLQALRENDMDGYLQLVQETKNDRLKFLINETDSYIKTINQMIQEQREDGTIAGQEGGGGSRLDAVAVAQAANTAKNYMSNTHRVNEIVSQPTMLKGGDLKEYQLTGVQWMVSLYNNNLNGILADEMGLGKTIQTIALLSYVMEVKHNNGPFMIVCPLSTLSNWVNETSKWAPDMIKVVYKGIPNIRKQIYKDEVEAGQFNILLTTYEYVMKDRSLLRKLPWQYIIVDEGHRMKNAQSKFAQTLGTQYTSKNRILLTGTPLQNNLPELWALLNFLLPTIFNSVDTFDQWFNKPFSAFKTQQQQLNAAAAAAAEGKAEDGTEIAVLSQEEQMLIIHRLHEVLRPFVLRRMKSQVLDQLPEKIENVLRCEFSGWQRQLYRSIHARSIASKESSSSVGINNVWMQLRKVCNHPYLFLNDYVIDDDLIRISGKFELLNRMLPKLKAGGHRVLLFSQMTHAMNILENFFMIKNYKYLRLDGNTTSDEREKRMYEFNDPDSPYFIFLLSTRAGGLGLNLATADTVIIFDSDWNPMMDAQAQDRAHRIGQRNEVRVFRLITNSVIEERILSRATDKMNLNSLVVEAGKFNSDADVAGSKLSQQETKEMMEALLKEWSSGGAAPVPISAVAVGGDDQEDKDGGDGASGGGASNEDSSEIPDNDQVNEMMATNESELLLYQNIDREIERERYDNWVERHRVMGITDIVQIPPLPPPLMEAKENPSWLRGDVWQSRYMPIAEIMANGGKPIKKRSRKGQKKSGVVGENRAVQYYSDGDNSDLEDGSTLIAGKIMRKRKDVMYDDGMTDQQYSMFVERQAVDEERRLRASKLPRRHAQIAAKEAFLRQSEAAPVVKNTRYLHEAVINGMTKIITDLMKLKRPDGSLLAGLFLDKPDRKLFPDYYAIVAKPIAMKDMLNKLKRFDYRCVEDIENDFALMSHNARKFNSENSLIFRDSEQLRGEFYRWSYSIRSEYGLSSRPSPMMRDCVRGAPPLPPMISNSTEESQWCIQADVEALLAFHPPDVPPPKIEEFQYERVREQKAFPAYNPNYEDVNEDVDDQEDYLDNGDVGEDYEQYNQEIIDDGEDDFNGEDFPDEEDEYMPLAKRGRGLGKGRGRGRGRGVGIGDAGSRETREPAQRRVGGPGSRGGRGSRGPRGGGRGSGVTFIDDSGDMPESMYARSLRGSSRKSRGGRGSRVVSSTIARRVTPHNADDNNNNNNNNGDSTSDLIQPDTGIRKPRLTLTLGSKLKKEETAVAGPRAINPYAYSATKGEAADQNSTLTPELQPIQPMKLKFSISTASQGAPTGLVLSLGKSKLPSSSSSSNGRPPAVSGDQKPGINGVRSDGMLSFTIPIIRKRKPGRPKGSGLGPRPPGSSRRAPVAEDPYHYGEDFATSSSSNDEDDYGDLDEDDDADIPSDGTHDDSSEASRDGVEYDEDEDALSDDGNLDKTPIAPRTKFSRVQAPLQRSRDTQSYKEEKKASNNLRPTGNLGTSSCFNQIQNQTSASGLKLMLGPRSTGGGGGASGSSVSAPLGIPSNRFGSRPIPFPRSESNHLGGVPPRSYALTDESEKKKMSISLNRTPTLKLNLNRSGRDAVYDEDLADASEEGGVDDDSEEEESSEEFEGESEENSDDGGDDEEEEDENDLLPPKSQAPAPLKLKLTFR